MKGDRLKLFVWLITDGVYGKITQPSDKLAVIDSELETYAPRGGGCGRLDISLVLKMAHREEI